MKKLFLKSLALVAMLLCGLTASATQYCAEEVTPTAGETNKQTLVFTASKTGDMETTFTLTSTTSTLTGLFEAVFQIDGGGVVSSTKENYWNDWTLSDNTLTKVVTWSTYPTAPIQLYLVARRDQTQGGSDIIGYQFTDIDVSQTCSAGGGEEKETIKPTMTTATLAEVSHNAAVINVVGTDQETKDGEDVAVTRFKVVYGETSKTYTATDGKIKIEGLELNKTYTFTIYAVDAAGNVSEEGLTVKATTVLDWSKVSYIASTAGAEYANQYKVVVVSGTVTIDVIQNPVQTTEPGIYCILPGAVSSLPIAGKTEGAGAWLYLSAFSKQETEVVIPYAGGSTTIMVYNEKGLVGDDSEKPVMVKAALVSNNHNSAVIAVEATDNKGVASYKVVDEANAFNANFVAVDGKITVTGLTPGTTYNLAISAVDLAGNVSEEAKTVVVTTDQHLYAPVDVPAAPVHEASNVISIYSDTYDASNGYTHGEWSGGFAMTEKEIDGNHYNLYTFGGSGNGNYFGLELGKEIDVTDMKKLHLDIWSEVDIQSLRVVPIWKVATGGANGTEISQVVTLKGQKWNSIDLTLADYVGVTTWEFVYQIKLDGMARYVVALDNIYFWKDGTSTAVDANEVAPKVSKMIENGQVVIIREGVKYNVVGAVIEK